MRKGFTLVEMLLVIVLIGILMTITMHFGTQRIDQLKYQTNKENFIAKYEELYSQIMTSNYHNGQRYEVLQITFASGNVPFFYQYDSGDVQSFAFSSSLQISGLSLDGNFISEAYLTFYPYTLGCKINGLSKNTIQSGSKIDFALVVNNMKSYCFTLHANTCKLIETLCP